MADTRSSLKKRTASMRIFYGTRPSYKHEFVIGDKFSDVIVKAGSLRISSHKCVLKMASPYFESMFTFPLRESNTGVVVHEASDENTIKSLVEMAYSNQLRVDIGNVQNVSVAADYLCMDKLKLFCEDFLIGQLGAKNVFGLRNFGQFFRFKNLASRADEYIANNFAECISTEEFLSLDKGQVVSLVSRADLKVNLEEEIFEACKTWVKENVKIRSPAMFELLQQVRFALIKPDYLAKVIAVFPACRSSTGCQQLISTAELYHSKRSKLIKYDVGEIRPRGFRSGKTYFFGRESIISFFNGIFEKVLDKNLQNINQGLATLNGKIYVTGGLQLKVKNFGFHNEVVAFSPDDKTLKVVSHMNYNRSGHGCCSHAGSLFVCGGRDGKRSTCCEKMNIANNKWNFVAEMNEARKHSQVVSCGKFLWAIGG